MSRRLVEKRGIKPEELVEVGLASQGRSASRGVGVIDRFRGRVLFPIRDQNGAAVGLGGRILGVEGKDADGRPRDTGPKYLNSPATPLFDKSRTLYLIDKAKGPMRKSGQAVIVEGYTDALMAHQSGFETVVASLGTALTPGQVALLTRYAKKIALAYDVDAAGQKAGTFGVQALEGLIGQLAATESGVELDEVRVVRLPDGKDPDEVLRDSPDRWREEVRTSRSSTTSSTPTRRPMTSRPPAARRASSMPSCPRSARSRTRSCETAGSSGCARCRASRSACSSRSCAGLERPPAWPSPVAHGLGRQWEQAPRAAAMRRVASTWTASPRLPMPSA